MNPSSHDYQEMEAKPQPNDLKTEMIEMLKGVVPPELSGIHEQCIYRVPLGIRKVHPEAYTPQIISIGPFHNPRGRNGCNNDTNILLSMEDLKLKYLRGFLNRTKLSVEDLTFKLKELENRIRSCYAGPVIYNSIDLLKIIITDACFIIELFLRRSYPENWKENDPIISKPWLYSVITDDLILLENQLPFFVLEEIYKLAGLNCNFPFVKYAIFCLKKFEFQDNQNINTERLSPKHFTDLLIIKLSEDNKCFRIPSSIDHEQKETTIEHVYTASQLSEAGLKFEVIKDYKCLLDLNFDDKGVLKMPCFKVHDTTEIYFRNILAYEECHFPDSGYIKQYMKILDFLINTEKDVSILIENGIIVNLMGDASSVATVINNLNKNVSMPRLNPNYLSICRSLNDFYQKPLNKYKATLIHDYFNTPWKIASTIAAVLLILLTVTQTICSIWSLAKQ